MLKIIATKIAQASVAFIIPTMLVKVVWPSYDIEANMPNDDGAS
ncbi:hypothetical protein [Hyphomicrobium methylovorum]|nr:hypothetical protein [Hyphomicrobium methylovorum]